MILYLIILFFFLSVLIMRFKFLYINGFSKREKYDTLLILIIFFSFIIFSYCRATTVGTDYSMYYGWYYHFQQIPINDIGVKFIYYIANIFNNPQLVTGISTFIFLFFMLKGIKKIANESTTAIFFFISSYFIFFVLNGMRQSISISIIFYALFFIKNKNFSIKNLVKFLLYILLASLFHKSAIYCSILSFLWILKGKEISYKFIVIGFLFVAIGYFTPIVRELISPLFNFFEFYTNKYEGNSDYFFIMNKEKGFIQFIPILIQFLFLFLSRQYKATSNFVVEWYYWVYLFFYSACGIEAVDRLQFYFYPSIILFFDEFISNIMKKEIKTRQNYVLITCIIIFWCLYFILRLLQNSQGIVPYIFKS